MSHPYVANGSVYDDFRAVALGTAISGRTSDSGHTWVQYNGVWTVQEKTSGSPDGYLAAAAPSTSNSRCGIDFGTADVDVELVTFVLSPANAGGIMFRRTASGYYVLRATDSSALEIRKITDAGSATVLATGTLTLTDNAINTMRIVCSGSSIDGYLDGVLDVSTTDSTYGGTVHGMYQGFGGITNVAFHAFNMHPSARPSGILVGAVAL